MLIMPVLDWNIQDVAKWGIQRRAQFRKDTKLSTMTAEEQSGGVRCQLYVEPAFRRSAYDVVSRKNLSELSCT